MQSNRGVSRRFHAGACIAFGFRVLDGPRRRNSQQPAPVGITIGSFRPAKAADRHSPGHVHGQRARCVGLRQPGGHVGSRSPHAADAGLGEGGVVDQRPVLRCPGRVAAARVARRVRAGVLAWPSARDGALSTGGRTERGVLRRPVVRRARRVGDVHARSSPGGSVGGRDRGDADSFDDSEDSTPLYLHPQMLSDARTMC